MRKDSVAPIQGQPARLRNSIFLSLSHSFSPFACNFRNYVLGCFAAPSEIAVEPPAPTDEFRWLPAWSSVRRMNVPLRTRKCCPIRRGQPQPQPVPEQSPSVRITQVSNANREPKAQRGDWERRKYRGDYFYGKSGHTLSEMERSVRGRGLAPFFLRTASIALGMGAPEFSTDNYHN